jgi:hypothetical protein
MKEQICQATDALDTLRRDYYQGRATYEQMTEAATKLLTLRQQAEKAFMGKVKTRINPQAIASLIRASF